MSDYLFIFKSISLPIFLLISLGYVFQILIKPNVNAYSKILLYLFTPVVIFYKIYQLNIVWDYFIKSILFIIAIHLCMVMSSAVISKALKYPKSKKNALCNSLILINSGNYGIPLIELSFKGNPIAMASQLFIMIIQCIISNTFGVFQASAGNCSRKQALKNVLKMPAPYAMLFVVVIKVTSVSIPEPFLIPMNYISDGYVGFALIALGSQLAKIKMRFNFKDILILSFVKLLITPVIGFILVLIFNIQGVLAQALIIGISAPTAVTSAILAEEFNNEPGFAAQAVFVSTVFCTFTIPLIIYLVQRFIS